VQWEEQFFCNTQQTTAPDDQLAVSTFNFLLSHANVYIGRKQKLRADRNNYNLRTGLLTLLVVV